MIVSQLEGSSVCAMDGFMFLSLRFVATFFLFFSALSGLNSLISTEYPTGKKNRM